MINHIIFIIIGLLLLAYIIAKVKKKKFAEKESLIWILAGLTVFVLALFPELLGIISNFMGVAYAPTALFLLTFFAIVVILIRKEEQITNINDKIKELAQRNAILEERVRVDQNQ
jgi:hypothetical protein